MTPANFEQSVDQIIKQMKILSLPSKCIFGAIFGVIDILFNGKRFCVNLETQTNEGCSLISRLSYLAPILLSCDGTQIGSCALETQMTYFSIDSTGEELKLMLAYGHFCEIMPEVHRKYYRVLECNEKRLRLVHESSELSRFEALDIMLSELALPYFVRVPSEKMKMFDKEAEKLPKGNIAFLNKTLKILFQYHMTHTFELPILSSRGFLLGVGTSYEEFKRFRAAWFAFADYCLGMTAAISRLGANDSNRQERLMTELLEWQTINFKETFCRELITKISDISADSYGKILNLFSLYTKKDENDVRYGDGYFPPFIRYEKTICFNPNIIQIMLSERNIPYILNRIDRIRFDSTVSEHMEPQLISIAVKLLAEIGSWLIIQNRAWENGEFDILVYSQLENSVLHIQAKAAIPVQGARMINAIENRIDEGLRQLKVFRDKPQCDQDSILSNALNVKVRSALIIDSILSYSSFGTYNIWSKIGDSIPLTPIILLYLVKKYKGASERLLLTQLKNEVDKFLEYISTDFCPIWSEETLGISDKKVLFPLLKYDYNKLSCLRDELWKHYSSLKNLDSALYMST